MGKDKYHWEIGHSLPKIDHHSTVKLEILEEYLSIYLDVLTQLPMMESLKLSIVDAFSGGGLYDGDIKGSPLRIKDAVKNSIASIATKRISQNMRPISFKIDYTFIEKKQSTFAFLNKLFLDEGYCDDSTHLIQGEFENNLDRIIENIQSKNREGRSIFILDQYGYKDATLKSIRKIFRNLNKAEVILTFSVDSLIDFISENSVNSLFNQGIQPADIEELVCLREDNDYCRKKIQPKLYKIITDTATAPFYTPFFIKSDNSNRAYWLFHFSTNYRAREEMVKLHWSKLSSFVHYGEAGIDMLGFDVKYHNGLFKFDDDAKKLSKRTLQGQLPKLIFDSNFHTYGCLKNKIANFTPATDDIIKDSLSDEMYYNDIRFVSKDGVVRSKSSSIKADDRIEFPKMRRPRFKLG